MTEKKKLRIILQKAVLDMGRGELYVSWTLKKL
jgi:hypothetical protein